MQRKHKKKWKVDEFIASDIVVVLILRADRTSTDNRPVFCKVLGHPYGNTYELQCKHEILNWYYSTQHLQRVPKSIADRTDIPNILAKLPLS